MRRKGRAIIIILTVITMFLIWPMDIVSVSHEYHNGGEVPTDIELTTDSIVEQSFIPRYRTVKKIKIYLDGERPYEFKMTVLDLNHKIVFEDSYIMPGGDIFFEFPVNVRLKKNKEYRIRLSFENNTLDVIPVLKVSNNLSSLRENIELRIDDKKVNSTCITLFNYAEPQHFLSYLIYDSFIIAVAFGIIAVIDMVEKKCSDSKFERM